MSSRINTYSDLVAEKYRLEALLKAQRELIRADVEELKQELVPVKKAIKFVSKLGKKDMSNPLATGISDTAIDFLLKKVVLARAGWITRLAVPFIAKNFSSHYLSDLKEGFFSMVSNLFSKNGVHEHNAQGDQPLAEERPEDEAAK